MPSGISRRNLLVFAASLAVLAGPVVARTMAFADESVATSAPDLSQMTPLERQVYQEAQRIYGEIVDAHGTVDVYASLVLRDRLSYQATLRQSRFYDEAYDATVNYSSAFAGVALGVLKQSPEDVFAPLADELLGTAIEESFLDEMAKDIGSMSAGEFVYAQAGMGARMVSSAELRDVMKLAEGNGGFFPAASDAAQFIVLYERNRAGFAALRMGKAYYLEQLQKSPFQVLKEMALRQGLDELIGTLLPFEGGEGWAAGYALGEATDWLEDELGLIVAAYDNPHIATWAAELAEIEAETERIFTAPLDYAVSRADGLMSYHPDDESMWFSADAWMREGFAFYRELGCIGGVHLGEGSADNPGGDVLDGQVALEYLGVFNGLVHAYGREHMVEDYETHELCKVGVSGGYLVDLGGGCPAMLVAYRSTLSTSFTGDPVPTQTSSYCELWVCPDGQARCACTWELRDGVLSGLEGDEFLNVCMAEKGACIETGLAAATGVEVFADAGTPLYALATLDERGEVAWLENPSEAGKVLERVPVAVGGRIHLANCAAFERLLAHATTAADAKLAPRLDLGELLSLVTYVGDPGSCRLSAEVAQAFADSIAAEPAMDSNGPAAAYLEAMLVDVGDDGCPFLIKTLPSAFFELEGAGHFISDAIFCYWHDGAVREYPFTEEAQRTTGFVGGSFGEGKNLTVGMIDGTDRGGVNVLVARVDGSFIGEDASVSVVMYYFAESGELRLFHKEATKYGYPDKTYFWDGEPVDDLAVCRAKAALEMDMTRVFFVRGIADQNAAPGTPAITAEAVLRAYARRG